MVIVHISVAFQTEKSLLNATSFPTSQIGSASDSLGRLGWHCFFYFANKSRKKKNTLILQTHCFRWCVNCERHQTCCSAASQRHIVSVYFYVCVCLWGCAHTCWLWWAVSAGAQLFWHQHNTLLNICGPQCQTVLALCMTWSMWLTAQKILKRWNAFQLGWKLFLRTSTLFSDSWFLHIGVLTFSCCYFKTIASQASVCCVEGLF